MANATAIALPKNAPAQYVLIEYNPELRELGTYTQHRFIRAYKDSDGGFKTVEVQPGIRRVLASEWELWQSFDDPEVRTAIASGILKFVSTQSVLEKVEDLYLAQEIVRKTQDPALLAEWAKTYNNLSPIVQEAMLLKSESGEMPNIAPTAKYVFGTRIG
jgi:hypothetical protein